MLKFATTWLVMIFLLVIIAKTDIGKTFLYYLLWLAVILLIVSHADELNALINVKSLQLNG